MRVLELAQEQGIKSPRIRTCYLCKREEGENSVCLIEGEEDEVNLAPIELKTYAVQAGEGVTFTYLLCPECAVLLYTTAETEVGSET